MIHFVLMRCLLLASTMGPSLDGRSTLGPLFVWLSWLTLLRGLLTLCKARFQHVSAHLDVSFLPLFIVAAAQTNGHDATSSWPASF